MAEKHQLHPYLQPLHHLFKEHGDATIAKGQQAYMKGQFRFHGIKTPERRRLMRLFLERYGLPAGHELADIVRSAWTAAEREMHYAGMELFARKARSLDPSWLPLAEEIILARGWWDTVDFIAVHIVGSILLRNGSHLDQWNRRWVDSNELWLQRTALIMQLNWKDRTDELLLFANCAELAGHPDLFIRKGVGWALRQYARTSPETVRRFVATHHLSPLSTREALKYQ